MPVAPVHRFAATAAEEPPEEPPALPVEKPVKVVQLRSPANPHSIPVVVSPDPT